MIIMRSMIILATGILTFAVTGNLTKPDPRTHTQPMKVLMSMTFGSRSHIKNVFEIGQVLQTRGHSVSYMSLEPYMRFSNGYNFTNYQVGPKGIEVDDQRGVSELSTKPLNPILDTLYTLSEFLPPIYRVTFDDIVNVIEDYQPDVMICDFFSFPCIDAAYHKRIPLITGFQTLDGPIIPPPYVTGPISYFPTTVDVLNFGQRFYSTVLHPLTILPGFIKLNHMLNAERARYGVKPTHVANVGNWDNSLKFFNTFSGFEQARPLDPTFKLVGPIMSDDVTPLSESLAKFLDSKRRVLYIAFGSGVVLAPYDVNLIFRAASKLIEDGDADGLVWALGKTPKSAFSSIEFANLSSKDLLSNQHNKIQFVSWAPQVAILNHQSVRVFLSHGGLESTFEAIYSGTPILTIPFFGDQFRNARKVEEMGFGGYSDRFTHTSTSLHNTAKAMLQDLEGIIANSILHWQVIARMNSKRKLEAADIVEEYVLTSRVCRNAPNTTHSLDIPCELSHLVPGYQKMSPILAFGIDVIGFALLVVIIVITVLFLLIRTLMTTVYSTIWSSLHSPPHSSKDLKRGTIDSADKLKIN